MKFSGMGALTFALLLAAGARGEDIVVIANRAAGPISKEQIVDIYLARNNAWTPIDQSAGSSIYVEFYKKATARDTAQVKAIWAKVLFTGRGIPPKQLLDSAAVKKAVAANPKAVGYIEKSAVDASVKVILPLS
jgi:hypothetical protein